MKIGDRVRFSTKYLLQCGASWSSYGLRGRITNISRSAWGERVDQRVFVMWDGRIAEVRYHRDQLVLEDQAHTEVLP